MDISSQGNHRDKTGNTYFLERRRAGFIAGNAGNRGHAAQVNMKRTANSVLAEPGNL
jgi:hypothetical protein